MLNILLLQILGWSRNKLVLISIPTTTDKMCLIEVIWIRDNWEISFPSVKQAFSLSLLFVAGHDNEKGFSQNISSPAVVHTAEQQWIYLTYHSGKRTSFFSMWHSSSAAEPWVDKILVFTAFLLTHSRYSFAMSIRGFPLPHCRLNVSVVERLISGHLLWVVNWTPQEEAYQHNRNPFSNICHIPRTQPALVFSFERGSPPLCVLCLKIRVSIGEKYVAQWQLGTTGCRGWMRYVSKRNYQYRRKHSRRQQLPISYRLITGEMK